MHDPKVTYRSVFGIEQDPPQWKTAFDRANQGLRYGLVEAFQPAWEAAAALPMPHVKLEKWRWLDFSQVGLGEAPVWTKPHFQLEVEILPVGEEVLDHMPAWPEGLVITTLSGAMETHWDLVARLIKRIHKPSKEKI